MYMLYGRVRKRGGKLLLATQRMDACWLVKGKLGMASAFLMSVWSGIHVDIGLGISGVAACSV
jgi:hypothetical protein